MTELVKYEAARKALAEAVAVDEVMQIHNQADAMRHAARIARDRDLEIQAAQILFRAERRLGELLVAAKAAGQVSRGQPPKNCTDKAQFSRVTLDEAGVDRKVSSRAQRVAALPAEKFETLLDQHAAEMRSGAGRVAMDLLKVNADQEGWEARRDLAIQLSERSVALPTGRQYPVVYADPPWHRKQGVTSRSYENHYPTMTWSEICALPVKDLLLPDAWLFLWIPRAHAFALHEIETEVTLPATGEVITAKVEMPLAWAVAKSWGCDAYSTAFVWTKTDEDHPDEAGGAVLARDQDELLLMFKRGRGLPKPDPGEKFGSNHRERSRPLGHSTKPQHYRRMIAAMAGRSVPVLELFARFDADNPPPPCWDLWGNQATAREAISKIADGGERSRSADQPAPPAAEILPVDGKVDSAANDSRAATAVPPADRPGSNSQANADESPAQKAEAEPAGIEPSASRVADGRTSDEDVAAIAAASSRFTPANEPHPLDIREFLRRVPKQAAAIEALA